MPTSYLFIDAANFHKILQEIVNDYGDGGSPLVRWEAVRSGHRKVFYYDALPPHRRGQSNEDFEADKNAKIAELAAIEAQRSFHIKSGVTRHRPRRGGNEQKMVDILLTVDALSMAVRGLFDTATIVTSDLDFEPLLRELVNLGIDVHLLHPRRETSSELMAAADVASPVTVGMVVGQGWLENDLEFPAAAEKDPGDEWAPGEMVSSGMDPKLGRYLLVNNPGGASLEFERNPERSTNARVVITSRRMRPLLCYARDRFGLSEDIFNSLAQ